jgi:hypothetical protein
MYVKNYVVYDKETKTFYNSYWDEDQKMVVKIPLFRKSVLKSEPIIEKFDLSNHIAFFD